MSLPRGWYAERELVFPPLPRDLEEQLVPQGDTMWSAGHTFEQVWDARGNAERMPTAPFNAAALLGAQGRGLASNGLDFFLVVPTVALFLEHSWGNVGTDLDRERAAIESDYATAGRIIDASAAGSAERPLVVYCTTVRYRAGIHVDGEWQGYSTAEVLDRALELCQER